jgi:predicted transcriptional regulator
VRSNVDLDEVALRLDAGESPQAIAADLGVSDRTIRNHLHAAGRPLATERDRIRKRGRLEDPGWLREQYVVLLRSPSSIAQEVHVSTAEVVDALESLGIQRRPVHPELTGPGLRVAFAEGETVSSIARTVGVDRATVRREMRRHGVENPQADRGHRPARLDDVDWLEREYVTAGRSMQSIADEIGATQRTVSRALRRHGFEVRPGAPPVRINLDPDWLRQRHDGARMSIPRIAAAAGVSNETVRRAFQQFGISTKHPNTDEPGGIDAEWLRGRYVDDGLPMVRIAREAGVSTTTVHRAMEYHGIARRSSGKRLTE